MLQRLVFEHTKKIFYVVFLLLEFKMSCKTLGGVPIPL